MPAPRRSDDVQPVVREMLVEFLEQLSLVIAPGSRELHLPNHQGTITREAVSGKHRFGISGS